MKNECDRCQEFTFDNPGVLFFIYHSVLCKSCCNDFELWVRTQGFWKQELDLEAARLFLSLTKTEAFIRIDKFQDLIANSDVNKLAAFPIIEAWVKAGKAKE